MAKAEIFAGICGFNTTVETEMGEATCKIKVQSDCPAIQKLAADLVEVDPFQEISFRGRRKGGQGPAILDAGTRFCTHAACPVPVGIIKAVEVAAGLALPLDVTIKISK